MPIAFFFKVSSGLLLAMMEVNPQHHKLSSATNDEADIRTHARKCTKKMRAPRPDGEVGGGVTGHSLFCTPPPLHKRPPRMNSSYDGTPPLLRLKPPYDSPDFLSQFLKPTCNQDNNFTCACLLLETNVERFQKGTLSTNLTPHKVDRFQKGSISTNVTPPLRRSTTIYFLKYIYIYEVYLSAEICIYTHILFQCR